MIRDALASNSCLSPDERSSRLVMSSHHMSEGPVRHILCAAGNNLDCLSNLLIFDAPVTYLSFPISAPRRLEQRGDSSFINLIDEAHKVAAAEMVRNRDRCFISPLSIDELPILGKVTEVTQSV